MSGSGLAHDTGSDPRPRCAACGRPAAAAGPVCLFCGASTSPGRQQQPPPSLKLVEPGAERTEQRDPFSEPRTGDGLIRWMVLALLALSVAGIVVFAIRILSHFTTSAK